MSTSLYSVSYKTGHVVTEEDMDEDRHAVCGHPAD